MAIRKNVGVENRLLWIQGLRGICALMVVVGHSFWPLTTGSKALIATLAGSTGAKKIPFLDNLVMNAMWNFASPSLMYVGAFFLISGFVVPAAVEKGIKRFIISRFLRIFPVLWVGLFLVYFFNKYFFHDLTYPIGIWVNSIFLLGHSEPLTPIWSLVIEIRFYILIIFCALLKIPRRVLTYILILGAVLSFFIAHKFSTNYSVLTLTYSGFFLGFISLGMALREYWDTRSRQTIFLIVGIVFCMKLSFMASTRYPHPWIPAEPEAALYGALVLFIITLFFEQFRISCPKYLLFLGNISYSLYIIHLPIVYACYIFFSNYIHGNAFIIAPFGAILVSIGLASFVNILIERPFQSLGKTLTGLSIFRRPSKVRT
jgi:peptidoglycan/LPS O-acetylase OafA/YrhL